ncbi:hypothetical protein QTN25_005396 [Entamoeba marina]
MSKPVINLERTKKRNVRNKEALSFDGMLTILMWRHEAIITIKKSKSCIQTEKLFIPKQIVIQEHIISFTTIIDKGYTYVNNVIPNSVINKQKMVGRQLHCIVLAGILQILKELGYTINCKQPKTNQIPFLHVISIIHDEFLVDFKTLCGYGEIFIELVNSFINCCNTTISLSTVVQQINSLHKYDRLKDLLIKYNIVQDLNSFNDYNSFNPSLNSFDVLNDVSYSQDLQPLIPTSFIDNSEQEFGLMANSLPNTLAYNQTYFPTEIQNDINYNGTICIIDKGRSWELLVRMNC